MTNGNSTQGRRIPVGIRISLFVGGTAFIAVSLVAAGYLVGEGIRNIRSYERFVTVKGLAEQNVTADRAVWPLTYVATDDELRMAQSSIENDTASVMEFLSVHGISDEEIEVQNLSVTDQLAQAYRSGPVDSRFIIQQTLLVRTDNVSAVQTASQDIGALIAEGVVLGGQGYRPGPSYQYTRLNDIKPDMIAAATASARASARQFAADAGSKVGSIRRANQGVFQILPADGAENLPESSQITKTVRAVVTLEYFLEE